MSNFVAHTRKKGTNDEWKDATWVDGYFGGRRYGVRFKDTDEWLDGSEYEVREVIKLVQYARKYQTELAKQKLLKIIKERKNNMQQGDIKEAYHHIESPTLLIKKDGKYTKKRSMTKFSSEEFRLLNKNLWYAKRKYDGTNMRIYWDGNRAVWNGKTNKFTSTKEITEYMDNLISEEVFEEVFGRKEVMIFGELIGEGIQGNELGIKGLKLIVFDINIGGIWLQPEDMLAISKNMGLEACDFIGFGTLEQLMQRVHDGFYREYEGIVAEPAGRFKDCKGNRIICKIKNKDYFEEK